MLDTGIADRLRAKGLHVVEIDGWRTRGSSTFAPEGSVDHHTAGPLLGDAPSLGICINGRSGLPGPLCNVLVGRYSNTCYVIAAGRANHAGAGGWRGLTGNSKMYGVERENVGTSREPWRDDQTEAAARIHAALIEGAVHGPQAAMVCRHQEWAPTRKIDTHTLLGDTLRYLVGLKIGQPQPPLFPEEEDDVAARPVVSDANPNAQWMVIGDNLIPVGSTHELGFYQRTGLVKVGPPEVWPEAYFKSLEARLNVLDK